jgi:hypothetical protein
MSDADNCGRVNNATPLHPQRGLAVPRRTLFEAAVRRWFGIQGLSILMVAIIVHQCGRALAVALSYLDDQVHRVKRPAAFLHKPQRCCQPKGPVRAGHNRIDGRGQVQLAT